MTEHLLHQEIAQTPLLDQRFAVLKKKLVKPEHKEKVIESHRRLLKLLELEVQRIERHGSSLVPEVDFSVVQENGGLLPPGLATTVRERGCVILRGVVPEEQAAAWEASLKDYVRKHPGVGGHPVERPAVWNVFWTKAQMEMRSHTHVLEAMRSVSRLWHTSDPSVPIDFDSQVVYPDRIRIRYPTTQPGQFPLPPHLDSGGIERWEDEKNRRNYSKIFEGSWPDWDGWEADHRVDANSDLYQSGVSCSVWRSLQGWLSLSHTNTGEGTLRLLPSLKLSMAYIMLRPLFHSSTGEFDDSLPTFPGSTPGATQFFPTNEGHPHLDIDRAIIGIPPVRPGDYVFWHCDLVHGVDELHPGKLDSSVSYNACTPLTPYNIESLLATRAAFEAGDVPADFSRIEGEREYEHDDCGAKRGNVMSDGGLRALGLKRFDEDQAGLTPGQQQVRRLANEVLGL